MRILDDLVGIQPMMAPTGKKYKLTARYVGDVDNFELAKNQDECLKYPGKHYVVDILVPAAEAWINEQPVHLWKYSEENHHHIFTRVIVSSELYTFLVMRWVS